MLTMIRVRTSPVNLLFSTPIPSNRRSLIRILAFISFFALTNLLNFLLLYTISNGSDSTCQVCGKGDEK
uniref:Uncharacterized protein n=1 Tax=Arundo donax TaxID=35708 RepID=A0A0A9HLX7_ARUDO